MREVKAEPRAVTSQGEKPVVAAGDTYASALGCLWRVRHKVTRGFSLMRPSEKIGELSTLNGNSPKRQNSRNRFRLWGTGDLT